jgi:hypothetical protein
MPILNCFSLGVIRDDLLAQSNIAPQAPAPPKAPINVIIASPGANLIGAAQLDDGLDDRRGAGPWLTPMVQHPLPGTKGERRPYALLSRGRCPREKPDPSLSSRLTSGADEEPCALLAGDPLTGARCQRPASAKPQVGMRY